MKEYEVLFEYTAWMRAVAIVEAPNKRAAADYVRSGEFLDIIDTETLRTNRNVVKRVRVLKEGDQ